MNETARTSEERKLGLNGSLALAGALFAALILIAPAEHRHGGLLPGTGLWAAFVGFIGFRIAVTGRISRWRSVFFVVLAWSFFFHYRRHLLIPSMNASFDSIPQCHIGIVSSILNYVQAAASGFWGERRSTWGPITLGFLWICLTWVIGKAWCSWGCFYGGLDEGFSRLTKKARLDWRSAGRLTELPAAILLMTALISFAAASPVFCLWLCPLKATGQFLNPAPLVRAAQLLIFILVGLIFVVILPILSKKRTFCSFICPFGAWQSLWSKAHPLKLSISEEKCVRCGLCLKACPVFAITKDADGRHKAGPYCSRCGECVDACPQAAISFTLFGRSGFGPHSGPLAGRFPDARAVLVFCSLLLGGAIGLLFVPETLSSLFFIGAPH